MSRERKAAQRKPVPADWERRWIRWAQKQMRRSEKQLLRETQGSGPMRASAPTERT